jgi:small subunit ribosomal protein S1
MSSTTTAPATGPAQVAINDIGSAEDFLAAIEGTIKEFNDGDIVEGVIVRVDRDEVLLDIGYKTEGVIPSRELSIKHDVDPNEVVTVGDEVEALVLQKEDKEGRLILSKKRAQYERAWGTIEKIKEDDGIVEGTVIEVVKGGLILDIGLRGFLPASLVEMRRVRDLQPFVGKTLEAKIIELDKNRNNVVLSRRAWLEQTQSEVRQNFLTQLQKGQVRKGVVSSIVNFGAFVDLGGVDGLVHVSELSWKHIDHPSEVVEVGQEVTVEVLDVDMDRERVSLSLKATQEDPWQAFARTHAIGQVVPGRVTKLVPFGAFVRVAEGIEGLVHISELAERHVEIPEQVVNVGDEIYVKVIDIDLERRRISLSLKQANEGTIGEAVADHFDPAQYGMPAQYDEAGNYIYPEGFDADTGEWRPGFEDQQAEWEAQYAAAQARWEAHQKQIVEAQAAEAAAAAEETTSYSSEPAPSEEAAAAVGTLASDEALAELRRKLTGGEDEAGEPAAADASPSGASSSEAEAPADGAAESTTEPVAEPVAEPEPASDTGEDA